MKTFIAVLFLINGEWVQVEGYHPIDTGSESVCYNSVQPNVMRYLDQTVPEGVRFVTDCVTQKDVEDGLSEMKENAKKFDPENMETDT